MPDTADLSRVLALAHKGYELVRKGHDARAAEKLSRAAEEAEKELLRADSLVTCALRIQQLEALWHGAASLVTPGDVNGVLHKVFLGLLSVMATLERRKAAGTLLPGSCRPEEEKFQLAVKRHEMEAEGHTQAEIAEHAAFLVPYVGVGTYLRAAANAVVLVENLDELKRTFVVLDEQKLAAYLFLAGALDLMMLPRNRDKWLAGEPGLVRELRVLIPVASNTDEPGARALCAAWQRVLRSGVLCVRGIEEDIKAIDAENLRIRAIADADLAAGRLQLCALAGCAAREAHASHFKRCGACRTVCYCCREHQVEDWPSHKAACKAARKAADPSGA